MIDEKVLYNKLLKKEIETFTDEECEWITYYESLKSRTDKEHEANHDPLVGALIRDKDGHILDIAHRASGQEGDHAEFVLLTKKLAGVDLTGCHLFTTLEPCVDDSRSVVGKSCSSIICKSEIKDVHIGILDPNPGVRDRGISVLFANGINIYYYSHDLVDLIYNSCEAFKNPTPLENEGVRRFKKDVLKFFDSAALKTYLKDCYRSNGKRFHNYEKILDAFILDLLRKRYVSFNARDIYVNDSIKLIFYKKEYLPHSLNRQIKIIDSSSPEIERSIETIDLPLPLLFHHLEDNYYNEHLDKTAFREIVANLIIHKSYDVNASLGYLEFDEVEAHFKNEASKNLDHSQLLRLSEYNAESKPGDGIIARFFNDANYCERSKRGQKTFLELKDRMSIAITENNTVDVCYKYF